MNELKMLGRNNCAEEFYIKLATLVGFDKVDLTAGDVLALDRAGVPEEMVARLRQPPAKPIDRAPKPQRKPEPPPKPPAPAPVVNEHPAEMIGVWEARITGDFVDGASTLTFTAEGRFILTMQGGLFVRGRWAVEMNTLILTADNGIPEANNFEFVNGNLKIMSNVGVILDHKVR